MAAPAFDFDALSQQHGTVEAPVAAPPVSDGSVSPQTNLDAFGRGTGLGTRDVVEGTTGPFTQVLDAATWPFRAGLRALGVPVTAPSDIVSKGLDAAGLPQPETPREVIQSGIQRGVAGAIPTLGAGAALGGASAVPTTAQMVGKVLAAQPARQVITGAAAGGTSGTAAALGAPPSVQTGIGLGTSLLSGLVPGATSGVAPSAADQALLTAARDRYNIRVAPAQAGSPMSKFAFSTTSKFPGATGFVENQRNDFNTAVGKTFGATPNADGKLMPETVRAAMDDAGKPFQNLAANTHTPFDADMDNDFNDITAKSRAVTSTDAQPVLDFMARVRKMAADNGGAIPGSWLQKELTSKGESAYGMTGGSQASGLWADTRDALVNGLSRYADPADVDAWQMAKTQWRNLKTAVPAINLSGDVSPAKLAQRVSVNPFMQARTAGDPVTGYPDLRNLAQIGQRYVQEPPSSGTTERSVIVRAGEKLMEMAPMLAGSALGAGGGAAEGGVLGAVAGVGAPFIIAPPLNLAMRAGSQSAPPPSMPLYYARALLNPPPTQPPLTFKKF